MKSAALYTFLFAFLLSHQSIRAQLSAKVYESPNCKAMIQHHQSFAILPMDVTMSDVKANKNNRVSQEELDKKAEVYQKAFQNSMYAWFLKRKHKGKMIDVSIQDVDKTNTILSRAGINGSQDLEKYTKEELANMLEVDAVFDGSVVTTSTFDQGGAVALAFLTGVAVKTGDADVFIKLFDKQEGEMIWSFARTVSSTYANSTDELVNFLMKRVSKRFPYEK